MRPAQERLATDDHAAFEIDDRLVVQRELVGGDGIAQRQFQRAARLHARVHRRLEETEGAASAGLGAVERHVGILEQFVRLAAVVGGKRDADRGVGDHDMAAQIVGQADGIADAARQRRGVDRFPDAGLDDGELVAADARDQVVLAEAGRQPGGHRLQQLVADGMAERIVDALELVEVEVEHGDALVVRQGGDGLVELLLQERPVGQVGKRVVPRHVGDLLLGLALLGDVLMGDHPAAAGHRAYHLVYRATVGKLHEVAGLPRARDQSAHVLQLLKRVAGKHVSGSTFMHEIERCHAGYGRSGREAVHLQIAPIADGQLPLLVEQQQRLGHVAERRIEAQVLRVEFAFALTQHRRPLRDQALQPAIEFVEFLDHQRDRTIGAHEIALELLVRGADEILQALEIEIAQFSACLGELSGEEPVHVPTPWPLG